jgi:hypothetical protein
MLKKKVSVKSKEETETIKPTRGRPKSRLMDNDIVQRLPSSRVFSVSIENKSSCISRTNNIIRLKLNIGIINKLERIIADGDDIKPEWEYTTSATSVKLQASVTWDDLPSKSALPKLPAKGLEGFIKVRHANPETAAAAASASGASSALPLNSDLSSSLSLNSHSNLNTPVNRKDLIINSGIKRTSQEPLQVFSDSWPMTSPYACWYCCHGFDTTPVGIPAILTNYTFRCYGNFCSYNCAKRYLCPLKDDEDDMASMQSSNDIFKGDDQGEKLQLLELLYHLETGAEMDEPIKTAPRRLILKMFGGNKDIEEFRKSFRTNTTFHTFKMPLASMAYHMEECVDTKSETRRKFKNMSLDVARLEQAYEELMKEKKRNTKVMIQKLMVAED